MHKFVHYLGDNFKSLGDSLQPQAWLDQQTRQIVYKTNGETFYLPNGFSLGVAPQKMHEDLDERITQIVHNKFLIINI